MNTINIANNKIKDNIPNDISVNQNDNKICIDIIKKTDLYLEISDKNIKTNIELNIFKNIESRIFIFNSSIESDINIFIKLNENSTLEINSFYNNNEINDYTIVDLNGEHSKLIYNYSCIGKTNKFMKINHNFKNTNSIVKNYAISDNTQIKFEITEHVPKNSVNCFLSQASKIINLKENKSLIKPILLIDEKEVTASHSSIISPINKDNLLYLMSRGINEKSATELIVNGFLLNNLNLLDEEKHILFKKYIFGR